jgi:hypothetical protein
MAADQRRRVLVCIGRPASRQAVMPPARPVQARTPQPCRPARICRALAMPCRVDVYGHLPACAGLLVGSTSCHRATPGGVELRREGGQVECGVVVAVDDQTARRAR